MEFSDQDWQVCWRYASLPTSTEFINLARIIMEEEGFNPPQNPKEALELYLDLLIHIAT